jgi:hypothetical protein
MLDALRLIPALQIIFSSEIEFFEDSFAELTATQQEAFERRGPAIGEKVYRLIPYEPAAIEQTAEKVTWEISIVTETEKQLLLDGVAFIYRATASLNQSDSSFIDRLNHLRSPLASIVTSSDPKSE